MVLCAYIYFNMLPLSDRNAVWQEKQLCFHEVDVSYKLTDSFFTPLGVLV